VSELAGIEPMPPVPEEQGMPALANSAAVGHYILLAGAEHIKNFYQFFQRLSECGLLQNKNQNTPVCFEN
jgi:hypothetical protein